MISRILGVIGLSLLAGCGGSGSNPVTGGPGNPNSDNAVDTTTDPNSQSVNTAFLFDPSDFLTANQFTYTPGATPGTGTIRINNIPFDGVSSQGGAYNEVPSVMLPNGQVFTNSPGAGENRYYGVILVSPTGSGALVGAVGTNAFAVPGYGGAYVSRPSSGLPPTRPTAYRYNGQYNGVRVIRQAEAVTTNNQIQLTTGTAQIDIDLQDLDLTGAIRGFISNRQLFDVNGNALGALDPIELRQTSLNSTTLTTTNGVTGTNNANGTQAQSGTWTGLISGPNGEEVVGYVVVRGNLSDRDPRYETDMTRQVVTGREVGGFVAQR